VKLYGLSETPVKLMVFPRLGPNTFIIPVAGSIVAN